MKLRVSHTTSYRYTEAVTLSHNQVRLTPREFEHQKCLSTRIRIEPFPSVLRTWIDSFGNETTYFTFEDPHPELTISLQGSVETLPRPRNNTVNGGTWEDGVHFLRTEHTAAALEAALFTFDSPYVSPEADVQAYAATSFTPGRSLWDAVVELTSRIYADFRYDPQATTLRTTLAEVLTLRRGVCQDFAHLQIACLRAFGLAARYVSGYLVTHPLPGKQKLVGADASHAWLSVFFPGCGWIDFDPTNNCLPNEEHITLAWGRDYFDVAPIKGLYLGGGTSTLHVSVDVGENT